MNRKGLELLRPLQSIDDELSMILEQRLFPPKFSTFLSLYSTGLGSFQFERILLKDDSDFIILTYGQMYNNDLIEGKIYSGTIDHIFSPDRLLTEINEYKEKKEKWHVMGFAKIGLMFHGDILLVGLEDNNQDEIWRYGQGIIEKLTCKLEDDIFNFFKKLTEKIDKEGLQELHIDLEDIYKKLDEDFWRIKKAD
jgi:hypothetical protein